MEPSDLWAAGVFNARCLSEEFDDSEDSWAVPQLIGLLSS